MNRFLQVPHHRPYIVRVNYFCKLAVMLKVMFFCSIFDAKANPVSESRCIGSLATNRIATVSACDLTAGRKLYISKQIADRPPMQHVCLPICSLTQHVLIALDLLLEQMRY